MDPLLFQWPVLPLLWAGVDTMESASLLQLHSWWTYCVGEGPLPGPATAHPEHGRELTTTAPLAVMEAILKRQAACAASQVSSHVVHWWPQEPSRDASKDCSGDLQALPPKPVLPSFNISFFLNFFSLHGSCSFPDFLALSDALKEKHLSSGVSFSLRAHHSQQASVACPHHPSFPGGRILASWVFGKKALTQPFKNLQNHMVFEDCIQFHAGCLATWLALNPLISC